MRKHQSGFIDPLSLISLGFLVISLLVGTVAVNKQNANYDTRSRAKVCADECIDDSDCGEGQQCSRLANGCPVCRGRRQTVSAPQTVPIVQPAPATAPDDNLEPEEAVNQTTEQPSVSVPTPSGGTCCPKSNTAGAINTCKGIPKQEFCTNQSVCGWEGNISGFSDCPALAPAPVSSGLCCSKDPNDHSPGIINTCTGINNPNSCNYQSVCQWKPTCSGPTPTPTPSPTSSYTCSGTCRWGYSICANGGWKNAVGTCPSGSICCGGILPVTLPTPTPTLTPTPTSTPTPICSNAGMSGICSSLNCCPGLTKVIGMYGSCQCRVAPTSPPTLIPRCSSFGSCVPVNNICERSYGQLDCRDSQKCGVHCSAPVTPSPTPARTPTTTSTPQCSNLCKVDPCCKCTTCDGNTALECGAVCNILQPKPTPTTTPILTPTPTQTVMPVLTTPSSVGLCEITDQCPKGYTCLNSHCVNNVEIEQCAADATVLANAAVGSNGITLDASYIPPGLVDMKTAVPNAMYTNNEILIQKEAISSINCFVNGMAEDGYAPVFQSGYRSYELQSELYEENPNAAAPAGESQHQTGLAFDVGQYFGLDENGNAKFFNECTSNLPECKLTRLAIEIAADCGIAHPMGWDGPHFFAVTAACPGLDTYIQTIQNPTATYYDELNAMIVKIQTECLKGL